MEVQKAVPLGIVAVGLVLLTTSFFIYRNTSAFISRSSSAAGVVTGFVTSIDRDGTRTYRPRVSFAAGDYEQVDFVSDVGSSPPSYSVGESVSVLYDPADASSAQINSFFTLWFGFALIAIIGTGFVAVGGTVFVVLNKSFASAAPA